MSSQYTLHPIDSKTWPRQEIPEQVLTIPENGVLILGRNELNEVDVSNTKVSRNQLEFSISKGEVTVEFKGSNPSMLTKLGEERILMNKNTKYKLKSGDAIQILPGFASYILYNAADSKLMLGNKSKRRKRKAPEEEETITSEPSPKEQKTEKEKRKIDLRATQMDVELLTGQDLLRSSFGLSKNLPEQVSLILEDIKELKKVCDRVGFYYDEHVSPFQCLIVRIPLEVSFLEKKTAKQWGLNPNKSVVIQLKFDLDYLLEGTEVPAIFTFLSSDNDLNPPILSDYETEFGIVQWFLETRLQNILSKNWEHKPEKYSKTKTKVSLSNIEKLIYMGFKKSDVEKVLKETNDNVEKALNLLLGEQVDSLSMEGKINALVELGFSAYDAKISLQFFNGEVKKVLESVPDLGQKKEVTKPKTRQGLSEQENLWKNDQFLLNLYNYINYRFITCPTHCLICDDYLDVSQYKLPVCSNPECISTYESTSCGRGTVTREIKTNPEVVDLLITFLCCAATGNNVKGWNRGGLGLAQAANLQVNNYSQAPKQSFEPFPYGIGFETDTGEQDIDKLLCVLDLIPPIEEMKKYSSDEQLKFVLDKIDPLCFPLLRWILQSNRTHLSLIPENEQIKEMNTPHQFQIISSFPEHERKFQEWRSRSISEGGKGTFVSFHGSPITNWHSIIRTGLRGGFVPGIYMAQQSSYSLGYMAVGNSQAKGWVNSMWRHDSRISCISLIEVADMRHDTTLITGGVGNSAINVANDHSLVVSRFLFFYPQGPNFLKNTTSTGRKKVGRNGPVANEIDTSKLNWQRYMELEEKQ